MQPIQPIALNASILVVDDTHANLHLLVKMLSDQGYTVRAAPNGALALATAQLAPPDLILLDIKMNDMDGYEVCQHLKADKQTQGIPVIFISALGETLDRVKAFSMGGADYVTKPFQQEEVLARVKVHVQLRALTKTLEAQNIQLEEQNTCLKEEIKQRLAAEAILHKTLQKLKAAQEQIIANEKLTFLGTLTAGIAHELRNPLNFVYNYAEGSMELIEEVMTELDHQSEHWSGEALVHITELLMDIRDNSVAIYQHGQRAEGVIRSMMQHARTGSNQYESTDLNALLAQAVQLAYHSMRAKNPSFNIAIHSDYDPSIGHLKLVASDVSRAFINIIENAYHALRIKRNDIGEEFTPTLWVTTCRLSDSVEIRIRDNGTGIAPEIRKKIFHPFFTTKPVGEGTGLGLALTQDIIVRQHQGTLEVATEVGAYAEFSITLPLVSTITEYTYQPE